jgi:hypothetical protein
VYRGWDHTTVHPLRDHLRLMLGAIILAAATVVGTPTPTPVQWEPSPEAARRILARMEEDERKIAALESLRDSLRGWPHDVGILTTGMAIDMWSTGEFRDDPSRKLVEANGLIGNGPGAAERHVALKAVGVVTFSAIAYELRAHNHSRAARIFSLVVGGGFAGLGVRNQLLR